MDVMIPMWLMAQKRREINVMVLVGKSEDAACTLLGDIQAELQYNKRYTHDFGTKYNAGNWQDGEFVTSDGVAFFARGRGQSPRGLRYRNRRPDYIVIDDLDDDELCENDSRVRKLTEWVKEALFGAFGAEGGRFIMVGNLISKCSVLANIAASKGVEVSQVNVLDKNGKSAWPEYWTPERIREKREFMGYRAFEKEYMNNPIKEGSVFRKDWIRWKRYCRSTSTMKLSPIATPHSKALQRTTTRPSRFGAKPEQNCTISALLSGNVPLRNGTLVL